MTPEQVGRMLATLGAIYQRDIDDATVAAWSVVFRNEDAKAIEAAVEKVIRTQVFFPSPASILAEKPATPFVAECVECGGPVVGSVTGRGSLCSEHFRAACEDSRARGGSLPNGKRGTTQEVKSVVGSVLGRAFKVGGEE